MKAHTITACIVACFALVGLQAEAQKGRGETEGLARQGADPDLVEIKGTLSAIKTGPCAHTTGQAEIGTHLFIQSEDGRTINLHVGPADVLASFVEGLRIGQPIEATAFRTDLLEADQYIAKTLRYGDQTLEVRGDDLQPFWARQRGDPGWRQGRGRGW